MSLAIRLARGGMKKKPYYRIVVTDSRNARDGKFIEKIGTYNPLLNKENPERVKLDGERASHWLSVGAQPSDRVARFLDAAGLRTRAARSNPNKGVPGDKAKERADAAVTKAAEAEVAAADAAEKAKAAAVEAAAAAAAAPEPEPVVEEAAVVEPAVEEPVAETVAAEVAPAAVEVSAESAPELADVPAVPDAALEAPAPEAPAPEAPAAPEPVAPPSDTPVPEIDTATETDASPAGPAI